MGSWETPAGGLDSRATAASASVFLERVAFGRGHGRPCLPAPCLEKKGVNKWRDATPAPGDHLYYSLVEPSDRKLRGRLP